MKEDYYTNTVDGAAGWQRFYSDEDYPDYSQEDDWEEDEED